MPEDKRDATKQSAIIYVTRDIERALGMMPEKNQSDFDYYIITNTGEYSQEIQSKYPENVFLFAANNNLKNKFSNKPLDTHELLQLPEVEQCIKKIAMHAKPFVVVFKNTLQIEKICKEKSWTLLNPSAALAEQIENKISQIAWLGDYARFLPKHAILTVKEIDLAKNIQFPFILQWAHSHTGDGTILVQDQKILDVIKAKFPDREARVTEYINGPMFTINVCVTSETIFLGNISYQITGVLPFTENPFSTVGNDWSLTHSLLSPKEIAKITEMANEVGSRMRAGGWRGLFGIDCIWDEGRDEIYLIEINARQPASVTYESQLQKKMAAQLPDSAKTIFDIHLAALSEVATVKKNNAKKMSVIEINDGAQIIQRLTQKIANTDKKTTGETIFKKAAKLRAQGYNVIEYANSTPNSDILRIQSERGILETHNKLNARGKEIVDVLL